MAIIRVKQFDVHGELVGIFQKQVNLPVPEAYAASFDYVQKYVKPEKHDVVRVSVTEK